MTTIDITIRKNTERKSFRLDWDNTPFIPPYIGIANTRRGVGYEHHNGSPYVKLGEEFPRSSKGYRSYLDINNADYMYVVVPKGLTVDLCGTIITAKKDSRLYLEEGCEPYEINNNIITNH